MTEDNKSDDQINNLVKFFDEKNDKSHISDKSNSSRSSSDIEYNHPSRYGTLPYLQSIIDELGVRQFHLFLTFTASMLFYNYGSILYELNFIMPQMIAPYNITPPRYQLINDGILIGYLAGSLVTGKIIEYFHRKNMIIIYAYILMLSTVGMVFFQNWFYLAFCRIVAGIAVGSSLILFIPTISEFTPSDKREATVVLPVCVSRLAVIFYVIFYDRFIMITKAKDSFIYSILMSSLPTIFYAVLVTIIMIESPRDMFSRNKHYEAIKAIKSILPNDYVIDKRHLINEGKDYYALLLERQNGASPYTQIFSEKYLKLTIPTILTYSIASMNVICCMYLLPLIFRKSYNTLFVVSIIFQQIMAMFGAILGYVVAKKNYLGRKYTLFIGFMLTGIMAIVVVIIGDQLHLGCCVIFFFNFMCYPIAILYMNEAFPTNLRVSAMAVCLCCGKLFDILGQFTVDMLFNIGPHFPIIIFIISSTIGAFSSIFLPYETSKKVLDQNN